MKLKFEISDDKSSDQEISNKKKNRQNKHRKIIINN